MRASIGLMFAGDVQNPYRRLEDVLLVRAVWSVVSAGMVAAPTLSLGMRWAGWLLVAGALWVLSGLALSLIPPVRQHMLVLGIMGTADVVCLALCIHLSGGAGSAASLLLLWPILTAALMWGPRAGILTALSTALIYAGLALLERGLWPATDHLQMVGLSLRSQGPATAFVAVVLLGSAASMALFTGELIHANRRLQEAHGAMEARMEETAKAERSLETAEEWGRLLRRPQDLKALLPAALRFLVERLPFDAGLVVLHDPSGGPSHIAARLGVEEQDCAALQRARPDGAARSPGGRARVGITGFARTEAIPLRSAGASLGEVYLLSRGMAPDAGRGDGQLSHTLVAGLALAVQNAQSAEELEATHHELLRLDQLKSDFLATVSHELRAPLTSIIGHTDMMLCGMAGEVSETQKQYLRAVLNRGEALLCLINDMLDLTKIQAGKMELRLAPVDLCTAVAASLVVVEPQARERRISVRSTVLPSLPPVLADPSRLEQILINLLSNAIKFSPEHAQVGVEGRILDPGWVEVLVTDEGEGIAEEDVGRIFERFSQLDGDSTRRHGGTGLGLAITRDLVELHGGRITVRSQPRTGSTFVFTIPQALRA